MTWIDCFVYKPALGEPGDRCQAATGTGTRHYSRCSRRATVPAGGYHFCTQHGKMVQKWIDAEKRAKSVTLGKVTL
jgi:hypothetical protein